MGSDRYNWEMVTDESSAAAERAKLIEAERERDEARQQVVELLDVVAQRDRLQELLASSRAQCDYAQQRCIRMQQLCDAAIDWENDLGCGGDSVDNLHRAIAAYKAAP